MQTNYEAEQLSMFGQDLWYGKMFPAPLVQERQRAKTSESFWRRSSALNAIPFQSLDLTPGAGNLLGEFYWELISPWRGGASTLNTGVSPRDAKESSLSQILQADPPLKYYLSPKACLGILRRAFERGKELPKMLARALKIQAGLIKPDSQPTDLKAFHVNQRNEGIDLNGVSGALMATTNMQMQTFVTQPNGAAEGFDGYNGVMAFAANQFGQWSPVGGYLATLLFGVMSALRMRLQSFGVATQLTQMLPYLAALIGIKLTGMRMRAPAANGAPYPHPLSAPRVRRKAAAAASTKGPKA